ncbi:hypothetical protein HF086_010324 [Spodoptera exigua]|uniref:Ig-like domain-containing protein n=1 Tax=Spodoptera exigua TaxID=7107 RepID=A0A922M2D2_SPOEX|nr:hypothetical protein HF086_010324 [Spodoptera exigua]
MTPFIHLYCVIWIELLTGCCTTTGELIVQLAFLLSSPATYKKFCVKYELCFTVAEFEYERATSEFNPLMGRELPTGQNVVSVAPIEVPDESMYPRFAEPIPNVTVTVGRDALLACVVDNLRGFKVAWVRMDTQTILSIHHNIITQNARISLSYNDHRSWYLHIKNVQEVDRGWYMCQVNTDPMRSRKGYLQVVVPPSIIDNMTSTDMVVREGSDVTLVCRASGYPEPYVMWRREDGQDFNYNGESVSVVDGETLTITKVSRLHMGAYLCIASNGVPPSISKRIMLMVQ